MISSTTCRGKTFSENIDLESICKHVLRLSTKFWVAGMLSLLLLLLLMLLAIDWLKFAQCLILKERRKGSSLDIAFEVKLKCTKLPILTSTFQIAHIMKHLLEVLNAYHIYKPLSVKKLGQCHGSRIYRLGPFSFCWVPELQFPKFPIFIPDYEVVIELSF